MEGQKDNNGFELQTTMAAEEKRKSIPTEPPKVPESRNSAQGPPKPSKSSTAPVNGAQKSPGLIENANGTNCKADETEQSGLALNLGYFKSWQAILKVVKMLCLIAMIVSMGFPISRLSSLQNLPAIVQNSPTIADILGRLPGLHYGLAASVIALITEIAVFLLYLLGLNSTLESVFSRTPWLITIIHLVATLIVFVAPIVVVGLRWDGPAIASFVTFSLLTTAAYTMELYFNMVWIRGGPELACLPFF